MARRHETVARGLGRVQPPAIVRGATCRPDGRSLPPVPGGAGAAGGAPARGRPATPGGFACRRRLRARTLAANGAVCALRWILPLAPGADSRRFGAGTSAT